MSVSARDYLEAQRKAKLQEAKSLTDKVDAEGRSLAAEEKTQLEGLLKAANDLEIEIKEMAENERMTSSLDQMLGNTGPVETVDGPRSVGEAFVKSDAYQTALQRGLFKGSGWNTGSVEIPFGFKETIPVETLTHGNSDLERAVNDARPGIVGAVTRRLYLADLIPQSTTSGNSVSWVQEEAYDESAGSVNAAAEVAETNVKPSSRARFEEVIEPVRTIAATLDVSNQFLEDVDGVSTFLDSRLVSDVRTREDNQLLNGDGTPPNISGILDRSIQTDTQANLAGDALEAVLQAVTAVQNADSVSGGGFAPTAIIVNPTDWTGFRLLKDLNGQYYGGGPFTGAYGNPFSNVQDLWTVPAVITSAIATGTVLVGAFDTAQLFRRSGINVSASNSHNDYFKRNMTAILAEERVALGLRYPKAFFAITSVNFDES